MIVHPDSRKFKTISTPFGYFRYRRLPFGISIAPVVFQRFMTQLLGDVPGVAVYLDDVVISGTSVSEHLDRLRNVLYVLKDVGLKVKEKCIFLQPRVKFLGHILDRGVIRADNEKILAIQKINAPSSPKELRMFLGTV